MVPALGCFNRFSDFITARVAKDLPETTFSGPNESFSSQSAVAQLHS
jgi:hypothetical protein